LKERRVGDQEIGGKKKGPGKTNGVHWQRNRLGEKKHLEAVLGSKRKGEGGRGGPKEVFWPKGPAK